jgi:hypothetical protein
MGRLAVVLELEPHTRCAPSPHSPSKTGVNALVLVEGWGGGSEFVALPVPHRLTLTPNPSAQGAGESERSVW